MADMQLRLDVLYRLRRAEQLESDEELAAAMGIHRTALQRVLSGKGKPGYKFLAGLLDVFGPEWLGHLFTVEGGWE